MSKEALNDIQKALNIIRSQTDKEEYSIKVKALELITQSLLSHLQALEPTSLVKNLGKKKAPKRKMPPPMPIPKSLNTPNRANNPNAVIPNQPSSQQNTPPEQQPLNY